jgi:26S proteasome regulatory subunit N10
VAFIGSPVEADEKELMKIAKKLKKEKVSIDIVSFGEDQVRRKNFSTKIVSAVH